MPHAVIRTVSPRELQHGDLIRRVGEQHGHPLCRRTVEKVAIKTKLAHIKMVGEPVKTVPLDTEIEVARTEPTDEENAVRDRQRAFRVIHRQMLEAPGAVDAQRERLCERLVYDSEFWRDAAADLVEAQAVARLWRLVAKAAAAGTLNGVDRFEKGDVIAATLAVADELRDQMCEFRYLSRSTSMFDNTFTDAVREAQAKWLRHLKYYVIR